MTFSTERGRRRLARRGAGLAGGHLSSSPGAAGGEVGGGRRVDEGGGAFGEVDAGEQRQEVADGAVGFAQDVVADAGEVGEQLGEVAGGPPGGGGR